MIMSCSKPATPYNCPPWLLALSLIEVSANHESLAMNFFIQPTANVR